MIVCGLSTAEDGALSACKVGAPVSESLSAGVSRCSSFVGPKGTNFPLHSTLLLKRVKRVFYDPIALLNEPRDHVIHLAASIIFVHDRLMLVHDQCDALEESR
jgi:hypothetical protein